MITVIKAGTKNKRIFKGECRNCGCIFQGEELDVMVHFDQRDGDFATHDCPQCKNNTFMKPTV